MSSRLEYNFEFWSIAKRISVVLDPKEFCSEELAFLDFCTQHFPSADQAWNEYRKLAPHRGSQFGVGERSRFDEMLVLHKRHFPADPLPPNVAVAPIPAEEIKRHEKSLLQRATRSGARQIHKSVQQVLHEVGPRLDSLAFASQRGMEAFRIATSLQPVTEHDSKSDRRHKRKLPQGLTMPSLPTVRQQRVETKRQLRSRVDISYLIWSNDTAIELMAQLPADTANLAGLLFDLQAQLQLVLELDRQCGLLSDTRPRSGSAEFELMLEQDCITPAVQHVFCAAVRVRDPKLVLWKDGHSRLIRLLVAWLPESGVRDVASARNAALSQLINERLKITLRHLSMDHLAASVELAVFHDCAICLCPADEFRSFARSPRPELSVQELGELYFGSVVDLALHLRQQKRSGKRPTIAESEQFLRDSVKRHSVHSFPSLFVGNSTAHVGLLRVAARKLQLSDTLSTLSLDDADRVQQLFVEAIEIDAQLKKRAVITADSVTGFDLSSVRLCVPELHCLAIGKALIHLAMDNPQSGSSKAAVQRAVLAAAGGKLKSIDDHAYAHHTRNVFFRADTAFAGCVKPILQANVVLARVFCLPRLRELSRLQTCCLAFAGMCVDPLVDLLLSLNTVNSKEAHKKLRDPSRYKHSLAHISLSPSVDKTEEALEHWVGQRKAHIAKRGAHNTMDIVREAVADEKTARARADYGLYERKGPKEAAEPLQCYTRGVVIAGKTLSDANIQASFAAARRRVPEELRLMFIEHASRWLISSFSASDLDRMDAAALRASHDVLCLCGSRFCELCS